AHWKSGAGRRRADQGDIAAIVSGSDGIVNDRSTLIRRGRLHDIGRTHDGRLVGVLDGDGLVGGGVVAAAVGGLVSAGNGDHAAVGGVGIAHKALRHAAAVVRGGDRVGVRRGDVAKALHGDRPWRGDRRLVRLLDGNGLSVRVEIAAAVGGLVGAGDIDDAAVGRVGVAHKALGWGAAIVGGNDG